MAGEKHASNSQQDVSTDSHGSLFLLLCRSCLFLVSLAQVKQVITQPNLLLILHLGESGHLT